MALKNITFLVYADIFVCFIHQCELSFLFIYLAFSLRFFPVLANLSNQSNEEFAAACIFQIERFLTSFYKPPVVLSTACGNERQRSDDNSMCSMRKSIIVWLEVKLPL